ncbi:sugar phosphate isomerase/epimerase family protein [Bauldia sp.]|uniref:sugar phosphate isomerase/epimerase family protein n=1 Tax=Bauldia sp. TaxID=2575872 RepID=UPI003BAC71B1
MTGAVQLKPGLCSVTFRGLQPPEIIDLATKAGLAGIEWASDVHVVPGDVESARRVANGCANAGLSVPTLGSYVRAGASGSSQAFAPVLDTCLALGANAVRIWAGDRGFHETPADQRREIADIIRDYCETAAGHGVAVSLEYHPNTLTDHRAGARWLLDEVNHPNCFTYWQPVPDQPVDDCIGDLSAIADKLAHLHVFYWTGDKERRPLSEGSAYWDAILSGAGQADIGTAGQFSGARWAFLEFVRGDDPDQFLADARVLKAIVAERIGKAEVATA